MTDAAGSAYVIPIDAGEERLTYQFSDFTRLEPAAHNYGGIHVLTTSGIIESREPRIIVAALLAIREFADTLESDVAHISKRYNCRVERIAFDFPDDKQFVVRYRLLRQLEIMPGQ